MFAARGELRTSANAAVGTRVIPPRAGRKHEAQEHGCNQDDDADLFRRELLGHDDSGDERGAEGRPAESLPEKEVCGDVFDPLQLSCLHPGLHGLRYKLVCNAADVKAVTRSRLPQSHDRKGRFPCDCTKFVVSRSTPRTKTCLPSSPTLPACRAGLMHSSEPITRAPGCEHPTAWRT